MWHKIVGKVNIRNFLEALMWNRANIRYHLSGSGLTAFLFWVVIGIAIHVWTPHGQDSGYNIIQIEIGRVIWRLVHFSYILAGYSFYRIFHWLDMTAVQALAIVSVLSLGVSGWSIFKIGYHFRGRQLGWPLSFLVLPLPLVLTQAQGQEYQPFATAMMLLAWYFWIVRKSLPATSIAWATSVLANPAHAFLFPSFTSFSLLESSSIKGALQESIRLWVFSAFIVIAVWAPFYKELFSGNWGVGPVMSTHLSSLFGFYNLSRALSFLVYAILSNCFIFVLAVPIIRIKHRLEYMHKYENNRPSRGRIVSLLLPILISTSIVSIIFGSQGQGRYYTPILLWVALMLLLGIIRLLPSSDINVVLTRWRWVGAIQLVFVIVVIALPHKYKAYARYRDYHMIADKYNHYVVAETGSLGFYGINMVEKRLQQRVCNLGNKVRRDELNNMLTSGQIEHFILVYGMPSLDRALLKRLLPDGFLGKAGVSFSEPEDMLEYMGFNVTIGPLDGTVSGNIFLVERASRKE